MHNNIMAAGSRDRTSMLATRRYPQWRSRFLRYIDTRPNGDALRKCILSGPYKPTTILVQAVAATDDSPAIPEHTMVETPMNISRNVGSYRKVTTSQKEVNELCAKRLARNSNPLALVATAQANQDPYYQTSKSHKSYVPSSKPSIPSRTHTTTRYKGKEIAKPITPPSETASKKDSDPEQAQRDKDMQKNLALIAKYFKKIYKPTNNNLRTSSNSRSKNVDTTPRPVVQQSGIQCFNYKEFRHFAKECRKPKRVKDSAYHKEKMMSCKQAEQGELEVHYGYMAKIQEVPTANSGTDSEPLEQVQNDIGYNVFSNDLQHSKQSESISNTYLVETDDSNVISDSPDMYEDAIQYDQNDVESDDKHVALANLKLDVDENKKIRNQLKKANTTLAQELKECKTILAETTKTLGESNSVRDSYLVELQNKQTEFEKYKAFNDRTADNDKLEQIVDDAWIKHSKNQFCAPTAQDMEILIQTCLMPLAIKTQNDSFIFVHELKQEMHADLKYVESLEKEVDELESNKAEFSNMYDMILQESVSNDVMCSRFIKPVTAQTLTQTAKQAVSNTNVLRPGMYRLDNRTTQTRAPQSPQTVRNTNPRASTFTRVNHKTNVSRPQHKSNQLKDKVLPNNSQVKPKKTQVEEHPRISSISNKSKSATACNDSLNSRTSNVNVVCATCGKCLVDSNHFSCVMKMLNDVNAITKKPNDPICQLFHRLLTLLRIVQLILFIVDSGCIKHMTGNLKLLCNFVEKFLGTVHFGNDQFALILGYGDLVQGNVAFRKSTCFVRDLQGNDLLIGNRGSDLYTISLQESTSSTPLCLMAKASPTQAWLWHRRLSHLNFDCINLLSKKDVVIGLPKLKYVKDQLCSSCKLTKAKRSSFKSKAVSSSKGRLNLLHMDLCGPMRVASINGKKYILVIVDDYSRYTWTLFLHLKDECQKGTKFLNNTLNAFFKEEGIEPQTSTARTPEQNNVVERRNFESIHIRFDEIKEVSETSVANDTSGLVPQRQKASDYDNSDPDEFFNAGSNPQDTQPTKNIQPTSAPSTPTFVYAEENNDNQAEEEHLPDDECTNPFCTPTQEVAEPSSHNNGNSNVPTFNQPYVSEYRWTKDHPLEKVRGNPSRPVQTRRQLATDPEMYMFALTEEVYVSQPDGFVDPDHPEKVYRLRKALYGLKQALWVWYDELSKFLTSKGFTKGLQIHQSLRGIFINQAKYALEILHKHGMDKGQSICTPIAMKPKLDADLSGNPVDQIDYHSKLGSLMYLTSSRSDIVQANCTAMSSAEAEHVALSASCAQVITKYQLADMFTKALPEDRFKYLFRRIVLRYGGDECDKGRMPTKIELTLEQSQQGVSNDILPHSSRVGFITTCSCSNYKDILSIKNQESSNIKTKTSANFGIQDLPSRYQVYQGRLLASFQDDAKYEHVGQDTRSQDDERRSRQKDKDLKISDEKTKLKDNDKG
nr:hypothetical protein [Tanacetum cinerariifolium]